MYFFYENTIYIYICALNCSQINFKTSKINSTYSKIIEKWYCMRFYVYYFTSYDMTLIWMAAIFDLSNMAPTAGAQLGSREKSKLYDLGYKCTKFGVFWDDLNNHMIKRPD